MRRQVQGGAMIIQRADKEGEGNAKGCDYLCAFDGLGDSPFWSVRSRALDVPNAEVIANYIHAKYGYPLIVGDNVDHVRKQILERLKSGQITKDQAAALLRDHAKRTVEK